MKEYLFFVRVFALAMAVFALSATAAMAQPVLDDSRIATVFARQADVVVRVKAVVDAASQPDMATSGADVAIEKPNNDNNDNVKTAQTQPNNAKPAQNTAPAAQNNDNNDKSKEAKTFLRLGTGFFISADGQILTNASVVHDAQRVWYEYQGIPYLAEVRGIDPTTNLALLQAKTSPQRYGTVNLADTVGMPATGTLLLRISLPFEFGPSPTLGLVQGADSQFGARAFPTRYLRLQLGTGPGDAGAPIFDLQGRFVGMTVAALPELGATYVIPSRAINWVREAILASKEGQVAYSYFGFGADEERSTLEGIRLIVNDVQEKGPAANAGLKVGDIIIELGGRPVTGLGDLRDGAFYIKPGQYLDLKVRRSTTDMAISIQAQGR